MFLKGRKDARIRVESDLRGGVPGVGRGDQGGMQEEEVGEGEEADNARQEDGPLIDSTTID